MFILEYKGEEIIFKVLKDLGAKLSPILLHLVPLVAIYISALLEFSPFKSFLNYFGYDAFCP